MVERGQEHWSLVAVVREPIGSQKIKQDKRSFYSRPEPSLQIGWQRPSVTLEQSWKKKISKRRPGCLQPTWLLVRRRSPLLILTGVLEAGPHASVEPTPPLPSFELFLFLCVVQTGSFILHLGRQFTHPLLGFLHQRGEVHCSAFQADNCRERHGWLLSLSGGTLLCWQGF